MADPVIFLGVPHYGEIGAHTAGSLLSASRRFSPLITLKQASLLCHNFNSLWCEALNMRKERGVTHFVMLHADLAPQMGWVDALYEELQATGADVVSVINAIKDHRGLTSTGRQNTVTGEIRRLTMKEICKLPETFDAAGAGFPDDHLMVNTGCWIADITRPWAEDFPGFTIKDWIEKLPNGAMRPGVLSEDWYFSGWLASKGLKVFATRKITTSHFGGVPFRNDAPWGEWDTEVGEDMDSAERIPGWMTRPELKWLRDKASAAQTIIEVGSWMGRSTLAMAQECPGTVYAVDHFKGSPEDAKTAHADPVEIRKAFVENLNGYIESGRVKLVEKESAEASFRLAESAVLADFVFIDGAHDYDSVSRDIRVWRPLLKPGAVLAGHDIDKPGVRKAVEELCPNWSAGSGTIRVA